MRGYCLGRKSGGLLCVTHQHSPLYELQHCLLTWLAGCAVVCLCVQELREKLADAQLQVQTAMQDPSICLAFLRPGRIIRVKEGQVRWIVSCCLFASIVTLEPARLCGRSYCEVLVLHMQRKY